MEFNIPICDKPQVIINPRAKKLLQLGELLKLDGYTSDYKGINIRKFPQSSILKRAYVLYDQIKDWHFLDQYKVGEEYLYMLVGCGKCELCADKKHLDLCNRASLEASLYSTPPYFITLTYDNEHLPKYGELCYRDVQLFLKRLRKRWTSRGLEHNIRYIVSGEYGSKFGRPHYHLVMYNNPYRADEFQPYLESLLRQDILECWQKCAPQGLLVEQCRGGSAIYATKYLAKGCRDTKHYNKPFVKQSIKNGGIGLPKIRETIDWYRDHPNIDKYEFVQSDGSIKSLSFGSYLTTHIYPSPVRCVPAKVRDNYRQLRQVLEVMLSYRYISYANAYQILEAANPLPGWIMTEFGKIELHSPAEVTPFVPALKANLERLLLEIYDQQLRLNESTLPSGQPLYWPERQEYLTLQTYDANITPSKILSLKTKHTQRVSVTFNKEVF